VNWNRALRILALVSLVVAGSCTTRSAHAAADDPWVLGYWVGYQADLLPVAEIPWASLTHIAVGPMVPRGNGTIDSSMFIDPDTATTYARQIAAEAIAHGVVPILMIGGGGVEKQFLKAASRHNAKLVRNLQRLSQDLGFRGFDLDYEGDFNKPANQRMFRRLIAALRRTSPGAVLTFPAITVTTTFPQEKAVGFYAGIAGQLDHLFLQTYGMAGPYEGWVSWHSSPLYAEDGADVCSGGPCKPTSVDYNVNRFLGAGIPAAKLGLGVGFYGTCWNGVTGPNQSVAGATVPASDNDMSYTNIIALYRPLMIEMYDAVAEAAYLSSATPAGAQGCTFVSYETGDSIRAKGAYARSKGLRGTIVWTINQAHGAADHPEADGLLAETFAAFR
jgi:chitinase